MKPGLLGVILLVIGLISALCTMGAYVFALKRPDSRRAKMAGRVFYALTAFAALGAFGTLIGIVYSKDYHYLYPVEHTSNDLSGWYRFAATWAGQEGSFLLWAAWTSLIGFLVMAKAGKYEARVMPFFVSVLAFLCAILLKQTPFGLTPPPSADWIAAHPTLPRIPPDGQGLVPSLQNYWMTIHPPTIFFGFASLLVPFCYSIAALLWKDYKGWTSRVMPYSLLSCATLGLGLFMGGYWAYETQGWHGFWAWDPVENASFIPWLAITALVHGLVVQKTRGGMARTNTFLGILAFWLFLLGTFLTRSGALSGKGTDGQMLSVHAFDNIGKSALSLMVAMMVVYGLGGLILWLFRLRSMPKRPALGETLVSRDFAFFMGMLLLLVACLLVTLGTTRPLFDGWLHRAMVSPKQSYYNKIMMPLAMLLALALGCVPWLAWRRTNPETFMKKLLIPWFGMILFGFFMIIWVTGAERAMAAITPDPEDIERLSTISAWISPTVQRMSVVALASLGVLAALSNAMLTWRVFRAKPLAAGGWLAHVGIGVLIVGVIVSNTYERTERVVIVQGDAPKDIFGYKFVFERMTGKAPNWRPTYPQYDKTNLVQVRVAPPDVDNAAKAGDVGSSETTFLVQPKWYAYNLNKAATEQDIEYMRWPSIEKFAGHDLYVGLANDPQFQMPQVTLKRGEVKDIGRCRVLYNQPIMEPGKYMGADLYVSAEGSKPVEVQPGINIEAGMIKIGGNLPELADAKGQPGAIYMEGLDPATKAVTLSVNLPDVEGRWLIPLEVTYKPWVNLVWAGVLIAVGGTLLAMLRRMLEARKISTGGDDEDNTPPALKTESWEMPSDGESVLQPAVAAAPEGAMPIRTESKRKLRPAK